LVLISAADNMPTVAQLKKELKKRGLDDKGRKAELEARLAEDDAGKAGATEEAADDEPPPAKKKTKAQIAKEKKAEKKAEKEAQEAQEAKEQEEQEAKEAAAEAEKEAAEAEAAAEKKKAEKKKAAEAAAAKEKAEAEAEAKAAKAAAAEKAAAEAAEAASEKAAATKRKRTAAEAAPARPAPAAAAAAAAPAPAPAAPAAAAAAAAPISSGFGFEAFDEPAAAAAAPAAAAASSADAKAEARRQKLAALREKMNMARKANYDGVREETKAAVTGGNEHKRKHSEYVRMKQQAEKDAAERGEDLAKPEMYETASAAEQKTKKQKKKEKNKASFGWEVFNQDNLFRAYKKRASGAFGGSESEKADYSALKHSYAETGGNFYPSANDMDYGAQSEAGAAAQAIPEANIARMVNELDDAAARRKNFSRRRTHNDERDVDSINERNAVFNRKVGRAFDKYTVEIRQNLERGTALPN
jgi:pre-mRNA-splicing factor SYF2